MSALFPLDEIALLTMKMNKPITGIHNTEVEATISQANGEAGNAPATANAYKKQTSRTTTMAYERVQEILESEPAFRSRVLTKARCFTNRRGRRVFVSETAIEVADALAHAGQDAHKTPKMDVLKMAASVLQFGRSHENPPTLKPKIGASVASVAGVTDDVECARFPTEVLPSKVASMVHAVAQALQVPEALPSCCALAMVSASLGKGVVIRSGEDRVTRGNLFFAVGARSGVGKTATYNRVTTPIKDFEDRLERDWRQKEKLLAAKRAVLNGKIRRLTSEASKADDPLAESASTEQLALLMNELQEMPERPRLFSEDITSQKLENLLSANNEVLLSASSEAGSILNNLFGRFTGNKRTDENIYVKAYSGDCCRVDRIGRDLVTLESPCLTVLWLMQPEKLAALFGERAFSEGGLLPRIMPCLVNIELRDSRTEIEGVPRNVEEHWRQLIFQLLETYHQRREEPYILIPTDDAIALVRQHHSGIISRRRGDLADIDIYAARWSEWVWRLSLVNHMATYAADAPNHRVEVESIQAAIKLVDCFADQQLGILEKSRAEAKKATEKEVLDLFLHPPATRPKTAPPNSITARDVQQAHIVYFAHDAESLLEQMEKKGRLTSELRHAQHGGHSVRYYFKVV
jgi:hypothetical protein